MVTIKSRSELPSNKENLNQVWSVSLLMTALTALTNQGLFELNWRPFIDTGSLVVICGNYQGTRLQSSEVEILSYFSFFVWQLQNILTQLNHFSPKLTTLFLQTALANKPWILQIFPYSKFESNQLTDWKVMAKKLTFSQQKVNFLAVAFQSVNRLSSNFEHGKIHKIVCLFAKAVCRNKVAN